MIHSFILSEGRLAGRDLELEALRLGRAASGLMVWVDLDNPPDAETRQILEGVFQFHPLAFPLMRVLTLISTALTWWLLKRKRLL